MNGWQASARWGCSHHAPASCPWCEGTDADMRHVVASLEEVRPQTGGAAALFDAAFSDEAVRKRRAWARAAAAQRLEEVRTSKAAREAWLDSFPPEWRAEMGRRLVAEYGQIGASA